MTIATNKKALHDYALSEKLEVGIKLTGAEVKSIKAGSVNLKGSFVIIESGELIIKNMHIGAYKPANQKNYEPIRNRHLLAHKKEIERLAGLIEQKRATIVPLNIHLKNGFVKLEIALARRKQKWDKRESLKKKDVERELKKT
ncbi:SsrA-binding protein SmpB [Candidatus Microgenomates bacterium]|nr:SsrA-binding protein SmpB [Candidatus Microgenomates bacterium]